MKTIFVIGVQPESLYNFRGGLIMALRRKGYKIVCFSAQCQDKSVMSRIQNVSPYWHPLPLTRHSINVFEIVHSLILLALYALRYGPVSLVTYTIKPNLVGACVKLLSLSRIKQYCLVEGVGKLFQEDQNTIDLKTKSKILRIIGYLLTVPDRLIFLNSENLTTYVKKLKIPRVKCLISPGGIGVPTNYYQASPLSNLSASSLVFLCISRISYDKGINEFIKASSIYKKENPKACFLLAGPIDNSDNNIDLTALNADHLTYLGPLEDIREVLASAHIAVLPSYHEGLSRFLMESLSMGKVLIGSDIPGCREMIVDGENGFLCQPKSVASLLSCFRKCETAMLRFSEMSSYSRSMAVARFDCSIITEWFVNTICQK